MEFSDVVFSSFFVVVSSKSSPMKMRYLFNFLLLPAFLTGLEASPIISEFLASNSIEQADEDGEFSDWVEIYNPDATAVNLSGWHLTDNDTNPNKWTFPSVSIPAGGYLLVYASSKDRAVSGSELHTNFKLSSGGEYLALIMPDQTTITSEFNPFPTQNEDISYGISNSQILVDGDTNLKYVLATPANDAQGDAWTEDDFDDSSWTSTLAQQNSFSSSPNAAIPDNATAATYIINVNGLAGVINDVNVSVDITHPYVSDLDVYLISPAGIRVELFTDVGGSGGNFTNTVLDDESGTAITSSSASFTGSFQPEGLLSTLDGQSPNGNWTLEITDDFAALDAGNLNSWGLEITPSISSGGSPAKGVIGYDTNGGEILDTLVPNGTQDLWVRYPFTLSTTSDLVGLTLRTRHDDGIQAYLNGTLIHSDNVTAPIQGINANANFTNVDVTQHLSALKVGQNVVSFRVVNSSVGSSDLLLSTELLATTTPSANSNYVYLTDPSPGAVNQAGSLNPGPVVSEVTENPTQPSDAANMVINATVTPRSGTSISSVSLRYRVGYGAEVTLAMNDTGVNGDFAAGDGIYSVPIPASASSSGDMLRWTVIATDSDSQESRMPLQADTSGSSQSPEYYGTVVSSTVTGSLPVMHWFTDDVANSMTRTGSRVSVLYQGKFYDNIYVRVRGGGTNGSSQKFDFNKGFPFYVNSDLPAVGEVNMNANGQDPSYVRQPLGFDFHRETGNPGCEVVQVHMIMNGSFDRIGSLIEQVDEDYLKRFDFDEEGGELFKFVQRSNLQPCFDDVATGVERKTGDKSDLSSVQSLVTDLKQATSDARVKSFYDNMDVQEFVNYMAVRAVLQQADDVRKNFYMYKDSAGDKRWRMLPWDLDWIFGIGSSHGEARIEHPFFGTEDFPTDDGADQWNRLYDVAFEDVEMQRLYLRRIRTLMDTYVKPTASGGWFDTQIDTIFNSMNGLAGPSSSNKDSLKNTELVERRSDLYTQLTASITGMTTVIPGAQPSNPNVLIDEVDFNPTGGDQDQEYIRVTNTENTEIDISGWTMTNGVTFTFPPGTVIPRNGSIYVSPKLEKFATRTASPKALEKRLVTGPYSGHLSSLGESITLNNELGAEVQTFTYAGDASDAQKYLVVSEFLYDPVSVSDAEFIEITNISSTVTVDLTGVHFSEGVDFSFTGSSITSLAPGASVLVVKNQAAFELAFGTSVSSRIAGAFANSTGLSNSGERITLDDATNSTIHRLTYSNVTPWPVTSGAALVLLNPTTRPDHNDETNWEASASVQGSPAGATAQFASWLAARGETNPLADPDGDGWSELLTYGLGQDLAGQSFVYNVQAETFNVSGTNGDYLSAETTVRNNSDVAPIPQLSSDLSDWADSILGTDTVLVSNVDNGNGTSTVKYRSMQKVVPGGRQFIRVKVPNP